jgi:hypothetical protein
MRTIVLNENNIVGVNNNTLIYQFPSSVDLTGCEIAVSNITMYYSWDNINSTTLQNNTFTYNWVQGATTTTYTVVIPNGLYELSDINAYFQYVMIQNGTYLTNTTSGQNVYYAEMIINPTQYAVQINTFAVPTSFTGFTAPINITTGLTLVPPTTTFNPVLTFPANFNQIVGYAVNFATDINTGGGNTLSYLSSVAPQLQPNSSLLIAMSGIDNKYANPNTIIYSVAPNVALGELIVEKPAQFNFNRMLSGTYNQLRFQFLGNNLTPVIIRDSNMTIILVIKDQDDVFADLGASRQGGSGALTAQVNSRGGHNQSQHNTSVSVSGSGMRRF